MGVGGNMKNSIGAILSGIDEKVTFFSPMRCGSSVQ